MFGRRFTSARARKAHRDRIVRDSILVVCLLGALLFLAVALVSMKQMQIHTVSIEGNRAVSKDEIFAITDEHFRGSYFYLFPRRNIAIFPKDAIKDDILEQFVRIGSVRIEREGLTTITLFVNEREPVGLWCELLERSDCFYVDEGALAFARAPRLSGGAFVVYERAHEGDMLGAHVTSAESFRELGAFLDFLSDLGFRARSITWEEAGLLVTANTKTGIPAYLRIPLQGPYDLTSANLVSILEDFEFSGVEYVDLRFENRVFYKKEGGEEGN